MASRFGARDSARSNLFSAYDSQTRAQSRSPSAYSQQHNNHSGASKPYGGYGYSAPPSNLAFSAYPGGGGNSGGLDARTDSPSFRSATPNQRGQYSDAVLSELESQNDEQLEGMSAKVKMLKDITVAIGDEIRDSTALAEKMNDSFEGTRLRLRGTMNRMLRMAQKTGVGWKVWLWFLRGGDISVLLCVAILGLNAIFQLAGSGMLKY